MGFPTSEQIETVALVVAYDNREIISNALQRHNCDVPVVVNQYYECLEIGGPGEFAKKYAHASEDRPSWDERSFALGQDGGHFGTDQILTFDVQGFNEGDSNNETRIQSTGRSSSRANTPSLSPTTDPHQHLDEDMEQALRQSVMDALPQVSGVTEAQMANLGPENRFQYDSAQWAMSRSQYRERKSDPPPSRRMRAPPAPVFLWSRNQTGTEERQRAGSVLTILHSIPSVRNVFLRIGEAPQQGYGKNSSWWQGDFILSPDIQAMKEAGSHLELKEEMPVWHHELHRLMAFLDLSDRSYGTAQPFVSAGESDDDLVDATNQSSVFTALQKRLAGTDGFRTLFSHNRIEPVLFTKESWKSSHDFGLLELDASDYQVEKDGTLYNILDLFFFKDPVRLVTQDSERGTLTEPARVLTMTLELQDGPPHVKLPETLYMDRYMAENRDRIADLRQDIFTVCTASSKNKALMDRVKTWSNSLGGSIARDEAYRVGIERCRQEIELIREDALWRAHEAQLEGDSVAHEYIPGLQVNVELTDVEQQVVSFLESLIIRMEYYKEDADRVVRDILEPESQQLRDFERYLDQLYTEPRAEEGWCPTYGYSLQGVVGSGDVLFMRQCVGQPNREADAMQLDDLPEQTRRWIKMCLNQDDESKPFVICEEVEFEKVLADACGRGCKPILVWATEDALEEKPDPLSEALKTFVKFDNRFFKSELENPGAQHKSSRPRCDSVGSMETNRASAGSRSGDIGQPGDWPSDEVQLGDADYTVDHPPRGRKTDRGSEMRERDGGMPFVARPGANIGQRT